MTGDGIQGGIAIMIAFAAGIHIGVALAVVAGHCYRRGRARRRASRVGRGG